MMHVETDLTRADVTHVYLHGASLLRRDLTHVSTDAAADHERRVVTASLPPEPVLIVGTGLVGTSVGLALRAAGVRVHLRDLDQAAVVVAASRGAGEVGALEDTG